MSITSRREPVTARIAPDHVEQLRKIADRNASTISRTIARIIAERLSAQPNDTDQ
jgi:hypothetical protein